MPKLKLLYQLALARVTIMRLERKLRSEQLAHRADIEWGRAWLRRYNNIARSYFPDEYDPPSLRGTPGDPPGLR